MQKKILTIFVLYPIAFFLKGKDRSFRQGLNPPCTTTKNRLVNRKKIAKGLVP